MATSNLNVHTLARRVARELRGPGRWILKKPLLAQSCWATLRRASDGAELWVDIDDSRNTPRLIVRPVWPKYRDGRYYKAPPEACVRKSVTFAATRNAADIARDLDQRLLRYYDPAHATAVDDVRAKDAEADAIWRTAQAMTRIVGVELLERDRARHQVSGEAVEFGPTRRFKLYIRNDPEKAMSTDLFLGDLDPSTVTRILEVYASADPATSKARDRARRRPA